MSSITLFTLGFAIFSSYMFFLLRMIWRQHNIQKENQKPIFEIERIDENRQAS